MKKFLLPLLLLAVSLTANAGITNETESHKIIMTITPIKDKTTGEVTRDTCHYYYDANDRLVMRQRQSMRYIYKYDEDGRLVERHNYSWVEANKDYTYMGYETYEYNAEGNISQLCKFLPKYGTDTYDRDVFVYNKYDGDIAVEYDEYFNDVKWYNYKATLTKNSNGNVTKIVTKQNDVDTRETWNTYKTEEISYQTNGDIKVYKTTPYRKDTEEETYYYGDMDGFHYAPKNFVGETVNGKVSLSWDAVEGANSYVVTYNQTYKETKKTSIELVVPTGNREFWVQPVFSRVRRNVSESVCLNITDDTKYAITDLAVGKCFLTNETADDGMKREFCNIPLTWTVPEGHAAIKSFKIFYDSTAYGKDVFVTLSESDATSFVLRIAPFEVSLWDSNGNPYKNIETPIYIIVEYETGSSGKSNVITVNPLDEIAGIEPITADNQSSATYNLAGQRVNADAKGIVVKKGKKVVRF